VDAAAPKLGNTITEISLVSPQELALVRSSHIGFNALELVTLANWIESPTFPKVDFSVGFRPLPQMRQTPGQTPGLKP
jgi:hypothetical protein